MEKTVRSEEEFERLMSKEPTVNFTEISKPEPEVNSFGVPSGKFELIFDDERFENRLEELETFDGVGHA